MAPLRICLTGPESTGKTELSELLRERFALPVVPEFARHYGEAVGRELSAADVEPIARGQVELTDRVVATGAGAIVLDTDLLSTVAYSRHYYGACPAWVEQEAARRLADFYFLLDVDAPWVDDGVRDHLQDREAMFGTFHGVLTEFGAAFTVVRGGWDERCAEVVKAVESLLG